MKLNRVRCSLLGVVLSISFMTALPASARQPPLTHALIHLKNTSNARATVYFKWGNDPWKRRVIPIGGSHYFNYRYDGRSQRSPDFFVRLDVDTDGVKFVEYVLSRGASPDDNSPRYGHHFNIKQLTGTDTRYIEAVTSNATARVTDKTSSRPSAR